MGMEATQDTDDFLAHTDFQALVEDLPVRINVFGDDNTVQINDFKSLKQGEGHATEAMNRICDRAAKDNYDCVVVNMGRLAGRIDPVGWLEHLGFTIHEKDTDHVTAWKDLDS